MSSVKWAVQLPRELREKLGDTRCRREANVTDRMWLA